MFSVHTTADTTLEEFENGGFTLKTHQMFSVHATADTTLKEFENGGFALKTHQMFSVHTTADTTQEEFQNGGFTLKTHQMFSVHTTADTTPEEFENGGFTLKTQQMFSVHTKPKEFQNGGFTLKTYQMFPVHTTPEELKPQKFPVTLDLCLRKTRSGKSHDCRHYNFFEKLRFQNVFCPHENAKQEFSNTSGLKTVFEKLRFRDGLLVWTVGSTASCVFKFLSVDATSDKSERNRNASFLFIFPLGQSQTLVAAFVQKHNVIFLSFFLALSTILDLGNH